jgi:hypothetical protein
MGILNIKKVALGDVALISIEREPVGILLRFADQGKYGNYPRLK